MLNQSWFRNQNNVVCCRKEEVLPKLARELAIPDLSQRVEEFQKTPPSPESPPAYTPPVEATATPESGVSPGMEPVEETPLPAPTPADTPAAAPAA